MRRLVASLSRFGFLAAVVWAAWSHAAFGADEKAPRKAPAPQAKPKAVATPFGLLAPDPRGPSDLTVCSQNLKLLGTFASAKTKNVKYTQKQHEAKVEDLVERFTQAKCDVIGVQEIIAATAAEGEAVLKPLVDGLKAATNRAFEARVGPPAEGGMALGFLVATDRATVLNTLAYARVELPKLVAKQRPRLFSRTPLELQLLVKARNDESSKVVSVVNFHLKSKRGGEGDPTGLEWETYRMEMAEAFRRIIEVRHQQAFASNKSILVVLGDRNSNFDVASARILEGSLALASFQEDGGCRLTKRGFPVCKAGVEQPKRLFSVLTSNRGVFSLPGTFEYKGQYSWLDDILLPAESLPFAWISPSREGDYDSGVIYEPKEASDHALVWVKLNW